MAEVINGAATFLEPQLMMLAAALDCFGYYRYDDKVRRKMHLSIEKCLDEASLDFPTIGSRGGIASAIANANNDLKHPDREKPPDRDALAAITALAQVIAARRSSTCSALTRAFERTSSSLLTVVGPQRSSRRTA